MPSFTLPLKQVIELSPNGDIGLNDYPIFDDSYREALNQKIIDHYWNQEIGQETISMFRLALRRKMNEIMPLYNQHYKIGLSEIDPLQTVSVKSLTESIGNTTSTGNANNSSTSAAKSRAVASETPQTQLMPNGDYASSMQDNISDTAATGTSDETQTGEQTGTNDNTMTGSQGHAPELIFRARQLFVNVDMMIIDELQSLFMLVWTNSDSYTERPYGLGYGYYPFPL